MRAAPCAAPAPHKAQVSDDLLSTEFKKGLGSEAGLDQEAAALGGGDGGGDGSDGGEGVDVFGDTQPGQRAGKKKGRKGRKERQGGQQWGSPKRPYAPANLAKLLERRGLQLTKSAAKCVRVWAGGCSWRGSDAEAPSQAALGCSFPSSLLAAGCAHALQAFLCTVSLPPPSAGAWWTWGTPARWRATGWRTPWWSRGGRGGVGRIAAPLYQMLLPTPAATRAAAPAETRAPASAWKLSSRRQPAARAAPRARADASCASTWTTRTATTRCARDTRVRVARAACWLAFMLRMVAAVGLWPRWPRTTSAPG